MARLRRPVVRRLRSPFPTGAAPPLVVHCCHHKSGTVWFKRVLRAVAESYGLRYHAGAQENLGHCDIFVQDHSRIDAATLRPFRGTHMVRDPRDIIISGYFYHQTTSEKWVHRPDPQYGGKSYQEHLQSLDREAGLIAEIERIAPLLAAEMGSWSYDDPRFLELRYEDAVGNDAEIFGRIFNHYGFTPEAVAVCTGIAEGFSLKRVKATTSHIRSGRPGEWEEHFTAAHRAAFKTLTGDLIVKLGYAETPDW